LEEAVMAKLTQEELKEKYEYYKEQIAEHQAEIDIIRDRMKVLRVQCKHPNSYTYSAMGELGRMCPDCGYQT
jgi:predicted  nucleic acid-binding Zn-ribbon protein